MYNYTQGKGSTVVGCIHGTQKRSLIMLLKYLAWVQRYFAFRGLQTATNLQIFHVIVHNSHLDNGKYFKLLFTFHIWTMENIYVIVHIPLDNIKPLDRDTDSEVDRAGLQTHPKLWNKMVILVHKFNIWWGKRFSG